jgi:3-phytase
MAGRARAGFLILAVGMVVITLLGGCSRAGDIQASDAPKTTGATAPVVLPRVTSQSVTDDPDDPAIWVHPTDPARSVVFATNKVAAPAGALVAFGLDGQIRQTIAGIDRPNNVDVEYRVRSGATTIDVAVVTERLGHRLRVFRIDPADGHLAEIGRVPVLESEAGEAAEPMGIGLYKRPADGTLFAVVAPKTGGATNYLWQYRLDLDAKGVRGALVRRFGSFSSLGPEPGEAGEIEAVVVDDALGFVYYADERYGIRKWHADPAHPGASTELAVFGTAGYGGDREGLALVTRDDGTGYLVSSDQMANGTVLRIYPREGTPGAPHDHLRGAFEVHTPADDTDGVDATSTALPGFPDGLVVLMNSMPKNFLFFSWADLTGSRATR